MIRIVPCWDDGVEEDIRLTELLRRHGARASFNLNPGLHGATRGHTWRYPGVKDVTRLARGELTSVYAGFKIANHSVSHPRPREIPPAAWRREVVEGRKLLQDWFGQSVTGFAYPFGQYDATVAEIVQEAGHTSARTCDNATPCHPAPDALRQPTDCHHAAPDFWERYVRAKALGASVFYFWGHSYEFATEADWAAFDAKLARLGADPDAVWTDLPEVFPAVGWTGPASGCMRPRWSPSTPRAALGTGQGDDTPGNYARAMNARVVEEATEAKLSSCWFIDA